MKKVFQGILCLLVVFTLSSCSSDDAVHKESMTVDYTTKPNGDIVSKRDGTEIRTVEVKDQPLAITFAINRISGSIDVLVYPENDSSNYVFEGQDIDFNNFAVTLSEAGKYEIKITCHNLVGDYTMSNHLEKN